MLDLHDLAMLYDLAKAAPVARAEFSHKVSALLNKVEAHLSDAVAAAKKDEDKKTGAE